MGVERARLSRLFAVDAVVIVLERAIEGEPAVADDEHAVDVAVFAGGNIGGEVVQRFRIEPDLFRRGRGPALRRPFFACGAGLRPGVNDINDNNDAHEQRYRRWHDDAHFRLVRRVQKDPPYIFRDRMLSGATSGSVHAALACADISLSRE